MHSVVLREAHRSVDWAGYLVFLLAGHPLLRGAGYDRAELLRAEESGEE